MPRKPPSESPSKGAGNDPPSDGMQRFTGTLKGLVNVPLAEYADEARKYELDKLARRRKL